MPFDGSDLTTFGVPKTVRTLVSKVGILERVDACDPEAILTAITTVGANHPECKAYNVWSNLNNCSKTEFMRMCVIAVRNLEFTTDAVGREYGEQLKAARLAAIQNL